MTRISLAVAVVVVGLAAATVRVLAELAARRRALQEEQDALHYARLRRHSVEARSRHTDV